MSDIARRCDMGPDAWNAFVDAHSWGWFWHRAEWLDYCVAYWPDAEDLSFAVKEDGYPVAIVPLVYEPQTQAFTMGGHPSAEPLLLMSEYTLANTSVGGDLFGVIEAEVNRLASTRGAQRWSVRSIPTLTNVAVPPSAAWRDISWTTTVMDLTLPEQDLWRQIRKSYRHLIRRAEREYTVTVFAQPWAVGLAHALHRTAAGRETRPQQTWDLMAQWAEDGHLITALAFRADEASTSDVMRARGMATAIRYKQAAYYASGATLDDNLSHALIWTLAKTLKQGGMQSFEVGWNERPSDSAKEHTVAFFKRGFGDEWRIVAQELVYG